mmetsp:Transcript_6628/g.11680  ORF Transcript_6628/g.11680 Transcript_6628/m.11680 type:complete len:289 (+) Transcript_6628:653-1519(+)
MTAAVGLRLPIGGEGAGSGTSGPLPCCRDGDALLPKSHWSLDEEVPAAAAVSRGEALASALAAACLAVAAWRVGSRHRRRCEADRHQTEEELGSTLARKDDGEVRRRRCQGIAPAQHNNPHTEAEGALLHLAVAAANRRRAGTLVVAPLGHQRLPCLGAAAVLMLVAASRSNSRGPEPERQQAHLLLHVVAMVGSGELDRCRDVVDKVHGKEGRRASEVMTMVPRSSCEGNPSKPAADLQGPRPDHLQQPWPWMTCRRACALLEMWMGQRGLAGRPSQLHSEDEMGMV